MTSPARVLVRPVYPEFLNNKLFASSHAQSDRWMEPYVTWRERAARHGLAVDTWDMHPLETAEVVVFLDLPSRRRELDDARRRAPRAKFVLMLVEWPLGRP